MTLRLALGFENVRDDPDLRTQGVVHRLNTAAMSMYGLGRPRANGYASYVNSQFGVPAGTSTIGFPGSTSTVRSDFGLLDTGLTVRQLWDAGGFALGARLRVCPESTSLLTANATTPNWNATTNLQMAFDGTRYWCIKRVFVRGTGVQYGSTLSYGLFWSTDFQTWTEVPTYPTHGQFVRNQLLSYTVSALGNNFVVLHFGASGNITGAGNVGHYSTDGGQTWNTFDFTAAGSGGASGGYIRAGQGYLVGIHSTGSATAGGVYRYSSGVWAIEPDTRTNNTGARFSMLKQVGAWYVACITQSATAPRLLCTTTPGGTWIERSPALGLASAQGVFDMIALGTRLIAATSAGIYYKNSLDPTDSVPWTSAGITTSIWTLATNGTTIVGIGAAGNPSVISTDGGVTFTAIPNVPYMPLAYLGGQLHYAGGTYKMVIGLRSSGPEVALTSSDGLKWNLVDMTMPLMGSTNQESMFGLYGASAFDPSAGTMTISQYMVGLYTGARASNQMALTLVAQATATSGSGPSNVVTGAQRTLDVSSDEWAYVEIIGYAVPSSPNLFNYGLRINGQWVVQRSTSAHTLAGGSNTTDKAIINLLPRNNGLVAIDDLVFLTFDGEELNGPQGPVSIRSARASSDVATQWTRVGGAASNAASVSQPSYSMQDGNYVESTATAEDEYTKGALTGLSNRIVAVEQSCYVTAPAGGSDSVQLGLNVNNVKSYSTAAQVSSATPTYIKKTWTKNPVTNAKWKASEVEDADILLKHV